MFYLMTHSTIFFMDIWHHTYGKGPFSSLKLDPLNYFSFQPMSNKGHGMCYLVCGMMHIKKTFSANKRVAHVAAAGFLSRYLNGPLPYVRRHITVNKMC